MALASLIIGYIWLVLIVLVMLYFTAIWRF